MTKETEGFVNACGECEVSLSLRQRSGDNCCEQQEAKQRESAPHDPSGPNSGYLSKNAGSDFNF